MFVYCNTNKKKHNYFTKNIFSSSNILSNWTRIKYFFILAGRKNIIREGTILFIKHRNVVYLSYENLCLYHVSLYFLYSTRKYSSMKYTLYAYDIYYKIIFFNVGGKLYNILYTIWQRTFLFFCTSKYIVHTRMSIVTIEEGLN